jgi:predicted RNA-binding Zn ribbon-like protein
MASSFLFDSNQLWLDFVNTQQMRDGADVDLLEAPDQLAQWLQEAGLTSPSTVSAQDLAVARRLREALRAVAQFSSEGRSIPDAALDAVDSYVGGIAGRMRLVARADGRHEARFECDDVDAAPLLQVALSFASFLRDEDPRRVRQCSSERCILFFYDTSKNHSRRWCSMSRCGNRQKVKAHWRRQSKRLG